jgi:starch-binding outer membrane protein, SusD/RagB family
MQKNIFKQYIFQAALLLTALLTGSCKKLIQIPSSPPTEISETDEYIDSASAMSAIAWVYTYAAQTNSGFAWQNGELVTTTTLSADELVQPQPYDPGMTQFYTYSLTAINGDVSPLWSEPYTSLYTVNDVLANMSSSANLSASFKTEITAEMKVVRAFYYFQLVNLFGGVPIVTTPNYSATATLARATVDSVYTQIISDLTSAQQDLPTTYPSSGHVRPNLYVADALLAKVYLYRQDWQDAYNLANTVISSGAYSLVSDPNQVFLDGSTEAIWQLPAADPNAVTGDAANFIPYTIGTIPSYIATSWLMNAFEPGDLRMKDWLYQTIINGDTLYFPYKYKNVNGANSTNTEDYMIFRLADLYLIRAEASAELGNGADALADVNIVRARAGLGASTADPASQPAVLAAVMHERQVELFVEWGNRWYDLKRTGTAAAVLGAEKSGFTTNAELYPIPVGEIQNDINLKQNPGY